MNMTDVIEANHHTNAPLAPPQPSLSQAIALSGQQTMTMPATLNAGAVMIEQQRAIADAKAKRLIAREYRRNPLQAVQEMREVCRIAEFAKIAFFSVPRGGSTVTGESIRMAEELARCWGNIEYGHRELSRSNDKSELMVFAIDLETGLECSRTLSVPHVIDTRQGPKKCRDQKEVDDLINNKASKQRRGCIMAVIPQWLREIAKDECRKTLAGDNTVPIAVRVRKMVDAYAQYGVTVAMLEAKIGHALESATADDFVDLTGIYNALKEGDAVADHFDPAAVTPAATSTAASLTERARTAAAAAPAAPAQPATEPPAGRRQSSPRRQAAATPAPQPTEPPAPPAAAQAPVGTPQPTQAPAPAPAAAAQAPAATTPAAAAQPLMPQEPADLMAGASDDDIF